MQASLEGKNSTKFFLKEEKAQTALEYILLLGFVIIQAMIIGSLYIKIVRNARLSKKIARLIGSF